MLVRWTQPAADDLLHICDYTAERFGAAQARRVADAIYETAASLQDMPNRGRKGRKPDTREIADAMRFIDSPVSFSVGLGKALLRSAPDPKGRKQRGQVRLADFPTPTQW